MKKTTFVLVLAVAGLSLVLAALPFTLPLTGDPKADVLSAVGRFHILALHLPIGLFAVVPIFELLGWLPKLRTLKHVPAWLMGFAAAAAYTTCVLGYLLAWGEGAAGELLEDHMWGGIVTAVLMMAAFVARYVYAATPRVEIYLFYLLLLGTGGAALTWGAHHGASLVHGEAYLFERMPEDLQRRLGVYREPPPPLTFASPAYTGLIQPILDQRCYSCHSVQKERGGFRMDDWNRLLAGGKSGEPGLVPGDLAASGIVVRVSLSPDDKNFMPPVSEMPLTTDELALLQWWVEGGASATDTLETLAQKSLPDDVEAALNRLIQPADDDTAPLDWPAFGALAEQTKTHFGIDVIPYSQILDDGFYVETSNTSDTVTAQAFRDLAPLAQGLQTVQLRRRTLEAGTLQAIANLGHVRHLHLAECGLGADDLAPLAGMRRLRVLNLYGNPLGDGAAETLGRIRSLRKLYLGSCRLTPEGVAQLREQLPGCEVIADDAAVEVETSTEPPAHVPEDENVEPDYVEPNAPADT